jgi:hypothetical protein
MLIPINKSIKRVSQMVTSENNNGNIEVWSV